MVGEKGLAPWKKVAPYQWVLGSDSGPVSFTKVGGNIGRDSSHVTWMPEIL